MFRRNYSSALLEEAVDQLATLPGVGRRTALRLALHLLDQPRETSFESEELQEYWIEEVRSNRRLYVIGIKWKF